MMAASAAMLFACSSRPMDVVIDEAFAHAMKQYSEFCSNLDRTPGMLPRSLKDSIVTLEDPLDTNSWILGFFPGTLWYIYEYTGDEEFRRQAEKFTAYIEPQKTNTTNHDVGFMIWCSYGNQYRLLGGDDVRNIMLEAAESLSQRYNPIVGCTQSWKTGLRGWRFPVIIDNMMNLELLAWASKESGNSRYLEMAVNHANTTIKNHFRDDFSSYHVVSYNPETGDVEAKQTQQGYADSSAWARGQAWGLYGYTMMYRYTKDPVFLEQAKKIAAFMIGHPRMPEDMIPYWDFDAPDIPNTVRDVSAAAIMCSALIELSTFSPDDGKRYIDVAEKQLRVLSSPVYTAEVGTNGCYLLKHSTGNYPKSKEVDAPLSYADYYYIEALLRFQNVVINKGSLQNEL